MSIVPSHRPQATREEIEQILREHEVDDLVVLVGIRGFFGKEFGDPGNDRGVYDDALFLVTPTKFEAYNFNTDPSAYREGIATLIPGKWKFALGDHHASLPAGNPRRYPALIQASAFTVTRDGEGLDYGWFGINLHHGEVGATSSEGCQTVYRPQWDGFYISVRSSMRFANLPKILYLLVPNDRF